MPDIIPESPEPPETPETSAPPRPGGLAPAGWAQEGIGSDWQHRFFYWLIRLRGKRRGYYLAYIVTFWYVLLYPSIRRRCRFYLDRRFPGRRGPVRRFLDTYRLVRTYGVVLVDMMALGALGPQSLAAVSPDHDRLIKISSDPRGFVLLMAHVGCFQVGVSTIGHFAKPVSLVTIPEARNLSMREQRSLTLIDPRTGLEGVMQMTQALLRGEILAMMGDRTLGDEQNSVTAQFLGGPVAIPVTPYRLASATGTPVVVVVAPKIDDKSFELRLTQVIEVPPGLGRHAEAYAPYAQKFADCLERFVQEHPWQFFNFYDIWHAVPGAVR